MHVCIMYIYICICAENGGCVTTTKPKSDLLEILCSLCPTSQLWFLLIWALKTCKKLLKNNQCGNKAAPGSMFVSQLSVVGQSPTLFQAQFMISPLFWIFWASLDFGEMSLFDSMLKSPINLINFDGYINIAKSPILMVKSIPTVSLMVK